MWRLGVPRLGKMNVNRWQPRGLRAGSRFATTRWSIILRAGGTRSDDSQQALGHLIECYWYPLYAFSRRQGNGDHDAMDLTQGFFTHLLRGFHTLRIP